MKARNDQCTCIVEILAENVMEKWTNEDKRQKNVLMSRVGLAKTFTPTELGVGQGVK